jgi:hypothetical protein
VEAVTIQLWEIVLRATFVHRKQQPQKLTVGRWRAWLMRSPGSHPGDIRRVSAVSGVDLLNEGIPITHRAELMTQSRKNPLRAFMT